MDSLFWDMPALVAPNLQGTVREATAGLDRQHAERAERKVKHHERRLDKLTLVCMALWSLLQEKTGLTEEDLLERIRQIDMADGVQDGKAKKQIAKCPSCNRTMSPRHGRCLYCGAEDLTYSAFDAAR